MDDRIATPDEPRPRAAHGRALVPAGIAFLQLAAVGSLAFAQPVFDVLSAEEFVGAGWTRWEAILVGLLCIAVPSALIVGAELLAGRLSPRLRWSLHVAAVAFLVAAWAAGLVKRGTPESGALILGAFALAFAVAGLLFARASVVRTFCTALAVLPLVYLAGLAIQPFASPLSLQGRPELGPRAAGSAPVVVIVLDELPVTSIVDGRGRIDGQRMPSLARFARDATWFPNATSVSDETTRAMPALVSGRFPDPDATQAPRRNLFTLMARSHSENVKEVITKLCPPEVCEANRRSSFAERAGGMPTLATELSLRTFLPRRASDVLLGGDAAAIPDAERRRSELVSGIHAHTSRPQFHFLHLMLPHSPWARLPDGRRYAPALPPRAWLPGFAVDPVFRFPLVKNDRLSREPEVIDQAQQAHLAQAGAADRQVGLVMDRLRRAGQYRDSLIVVTADHGAAFQRGGSFRRLTRANAPEILGVPLLIKRPGHRPGGIDRTFARTTDLLPTIAREAGVRLDWPVDGKALFRPRARPHAVRAVSAFGGKESSYSPAALVRGRARARRRQAAVFGPGTDEVELFAAGPRPDLLGRRAASAGRAPLRQVPVTLGPAEGAATARDAVPAAVGGTVAGGRTGQVLAVAVDGRVAATTRSYAFDGTQRFSALLPPSAMPSNGKRVQVFAVPPPGR